MTKILYSVSPIGLGHATRAVAVGLKLRERGLEPEFATGGRASSFIQSLGFTVHKVVSEPLPFESKGRIRYAGLWYVKYWLGYRSTYRRMEDLVRSLEPEFILGDEEFASVSIALKRGTKHALMTDELELDFAKSFLAEMIETRVRRWYSNLQNSVSHLIIPDFGEDIGKTHFVTPVVRDVTKDRPSVFAEHGLPAGKKMILFSKSGTGLGKLFEERTVRAFNDSGASDCFLAIAGGEKSLPDRDILRLGAIADNQNMVAAADLVISTAGKSTIDEAQSCGTPIIAIPFKDHFEQERNAKNLGFTFEDIERLDVLIPEHLGRRSQPRPYRGAENVAALVAKLI